MKCSTQYILYSDVIFIETFERLIMQYYIYLIYYKIAEGY